MPDVIGLGEIMVQFNAVTPGPLRHVVYFEKHAAGAEANVTVCVRRQGLSSGFITRLGADEFGIYIYNWLRGEGVDVSQIKIRHHSSYRNLFHSKGLSDTGKKLGRLLSKRISCEQAQRRRHKFRILRRCEGLPSHRHNPGIKRICTKGVQEGCKMRQESWMQTII